MRWLLTSQGSPLPCCEAVPVACQHTWQTVCINPVLSSMLSRLTLTIQAQSLHGARKTLYQLPGSTRLGCDQTNTPLLLFSTSNKAEKQAEGSSMRLDLKKVQSLYPRVLKNRQEPCYSIRSFIPLPLIQVSSVQVKWNFFYPGFLSWSKAMIKDIFCFTSL